MSHFVTYVILPLTRAESEDRTQAMVAAVQAGAPLRQAVEAHKTEIEQLLADLLEPYREERRVAPYDVQMTPEEVARMAGHYKTTNLSALAERITDWNGGEQGRVEDGTLVYTSDANPTPRWDWYTLGGRWSGSMQMTEAEQVESRRLLETVGAEAATRYEDALGIGQRANLCYLSRIANPDPPFAVVTPEGKWHEKARMGWFGATDMKASPRLLQAQAAYDDAMARQVTGAELEAINAEWRAAFHEVEAACEAEWASAYAQIVRPYRAADHLVACVDCHI